MKAFVKGWPESAVTCGPFCLAHPAYRHQSLVRRPDSPVSQQWLTPPPVAPDGNGNPSRPVQLSLSPGGLFRAKAPRRNRAP